jgi:hypothetical protein
VRVVNETENRHLLLPRTGVPLGGFESVGEFEGATRGPFCRKAPAGVTVEDAFTDEW